VDDLTIAAEDLKAITEVLMSKYKFKLKGTGPISFFLGCDYFRDNDGILCYLVAAYGLRRRPKSSVIGRNYVTDRNFAFLLINTNSYDFRNIQ
jgi:hypothetical protein